MNPHLIRSWHRGLVLLAALAVGALLGCNRGGSTPAASPVLTPTRDPHELIAPNHSIKPLQQTAPPDGTAQYKAESATSNFGSTESKHVMLDLFVTY